MLFPLCNNPDDLGEHEQNVGEYFKKTDPSLEHWFIQNFILETSAIILLTQDVLPLHLHGRELQA